MIRYNSIWQNLAALFYIAITDELFSMAFIWQVMAFITFSTVMTGFGYLVNDLADKDLDRLQGKPNAFENISRKRAVLVTATILGVGSLLALPFLGRAWFVPLWALWILAAASYSLPPLRLKERGLPGLLVTIAAQQTLPMGMLFAAFGTLWSWGGLTFIVYATLRGISSDASHQMRERRMDAGAGSRTYAVRRGRRPIQKVVAASLELERLALGGVMALLLPALPAAGIPLVDWQVSIAWPLVFLYLPLLLMTGGASWRALQQGRLEQEDPYDEARQARKRDAMHAIHHPLPSVITPFYLGLWLSIYYWPNAIFLLILFFLYGLYSPQRWLESWPLRPLLAYLHVSRKREALK